MVKVKCNICESTKIAKHDNLDMFQCKKCESPRCPKCFSLLWQYDHWGNRHPHFKCPSCDIMLHTKPSLEIATVVGKNCGTCLQLGIYAGFGETVTINCSDDIEGAEWGDNVSKTNTWNQLLGASVCKSWDSLSND